MRVASLFLLLLAGACASPTPGKKSARPIVEDDVTAGDESPSNTEDLDPVLEGETTPGSEETPSPGSGTSAAAGTKLTWNAIAGFKYAVGIKVPEGWVAGCIKVGTATSAVYDGVCPNAPAQTPNPLGYRVYFSDTDAFGDFVEQPAGGSEIKFDLPTTSPSSVPVTWRQKSPTAEYSLDVVLKGGQLIAPCIHAGILGAGLTHTFDGRCFDGASAPIANIREFRICWTEGGDWSKASCAGVPYSGLGRNAAIAN